MRDIPVFTTQYGVASLTLREIPYQQIAYVRVQSTQQPAELVEEVIGFCRACGAEQIVATGDDFLRKYPHHASVIRMQCMRESLPEANACLWPVTPETLSEWLKIYNQKIRSVHNAAWMDARDGKQMISDGDGYFIHKDGKLLGIGRASGDCIKWVAAVEKGQGKTVVLSLAQILFSDVVALEVASTNEKAMNLYQSLGFVPVEEISSWYKIY